MNSATLKKSTVKELADKSKKVLIASLLLSVFFHALSYVNLNYVARIARDRFPIGNLAPIKVKIVTKTPEEAKKDRIIEEQKKQQADVRLQKTEKPDEAKYSSYQDHKTEKETRVEVTNTEKAKNAGPKGFEKEIQEIMKPQPQQQAKPQEDMAKVTPKLEFAPGGSLPMPAKDPALRKRREAYKKFMPTPKQLAGLADAGYQQYLDESVQLGDTIDINTSEYRYMGYFSMMRKAIELVWNYPMEAAQRGMQGEVGVEFVIHKEGRISRLSVFKSSGYKILDDAIVNAIKLASPFAPLPPGFGKDMMKITGSFRYSLSPYMAGH